MDLRLMRTMASATGAIPDPQPPQSILLKLSLNAVYWIVTQDEICGKLIGASTMQKACDLAACNHAGTVDTCQLNQLGIGCSGCVTAVGGDPEIRRRLMEMGFCSGTPVELVRRAPLGDPIEFRIRGYNLSLREEQAACVSVRTETDPQAQE